MSSLKGHHGKGPVTSSGWEALSGVLRAFGPFDGLLQEEDVHCIGSKE